MRDKGEEQVRNYLLFKCGSTWKGFCKGNVMLWSRLSSPGKPWRGLIDWIESVFWYPSAQQSPHQALWPSFSMQQPHKTLLTTPKTAFEPCFGSIILISLPALWQFWYCFVFIPGWPQTLQLRMTLNESTCLYPLSAGIAVIYHHTYILGIESRSSYILGKNESTEFHTQLKWRHSFRFKVIQTTASRPPVSGKYGYRDVNENFCGTKHSGTHLWSWHSVHWGKRSANLRPS